MAGGRASDRIWGKVSAGYIRNRQDVPPENRAESPELNGIPHDEKDGIEDFFACRMARYLRSEGPSRDLRFELAPHGLRKTRRSVMMQNAVRKRSRTLSGVRGYCWSMC